VDKFDIHIGVAAPMLQSNIDTDAIIPSREMKRVSKQGLGEGLFAFWRYTLPGGRELAPEFILNQSEYAHTSILLSGANFGCGSSREHAVWALKEYGIKVIIAVSFGSIFYNNCIRNGILPLRLSYGDIEFLADKIKTGPQSQILTVNLSETSVVTIHGETFNFDIEPTYQNMLLEGLDVIDMTLKMGDKISQFQQHYRLAYPWLDESPDPLKT